MTKILPPRERISLVSALMLYESTELMRMRRKAEDKNERKKRKKRKKTNK